jgi:hypothetical protein
VGGADGRGVATACEAVALHALRSIPPKTYRPGRPMGHPFSVLPGSWAVCRLAPDAAVPEWAHTPAFSCITRTIDELSIVVPEAAVPAGTLAEGGWAVLKLQGPFPFTAIGVLASIAGPLAAARIGIFVVSTFDTDYVLVKHASLAAAISALESAGHVRIET